MAAPLADALEGNAEEELTIDLAIEWDSRAQRSVVVQDAVVGDGPREGAAEREEAGLEREAPERRPKAKRCRTFVKLLASLPDGTHLLHVRCASIAAWTIEALTERRQHVGPQQSHIACAADSARGWSGAALAPYGDPGGNRADFCIQKCEGLCSVHPKPLNPWLVRASCARLTTGRRHQIRCHLAAIGLPIANDRRYGGTVPARGERPPPFTDDAQGTLARAVGPTSAAYRQWCPKCRWTAAVLSGERPPPTVDDTEEIWLRSWRYTLPSMGIDVASPIPAWAKVLPAHACG